jgi:plasmid maintenance system antidote protein VapI
MTERTALNERFKVVFEELVKRSEIVKNNRAKSMTAFAKKLGTRGHIISCYLNDADDRKITFDQAKKLCDNFDVSQDFIFKGKGKLFLNKKDLPSPDDKIAMILNIPFHHNILFTSVEAFSSNTISVEVLEDNQRFFIPGVDGDLVAFNINGRSMEPTITSGDMVICSSVQQNSDVRDNQIYAIVTNSAVWVKRVYRQFDSKGKWTHLRLVSDNVEEFDPFVVDVLEIRKVLKVRKRLTGLEDFD